MNQLSALFHQTFDPLIQAELESNHVGLGGNRAVEPVTKQSRYRQALLYNLLLQTSCFRYWGQGAWTDYAREIYQRGEAMLGSI